MRSLIKLLAFLSLTCGCLTVNAKTEQYKVWYIPLDRSYYAPVTSEDIEEKATLKLAISSSKIDQLFSEAEKKIESKSLKPGNDFRIKFMRKRDGSVLYINRDKSVIFEDVLVNVPSATLQGVINLVERKRK